MRTFTALLILTATVLATDGVAERVRKLTQRFEAGNAVERARVLVELRQLGDQGLEALMQLAAKRPDRADKPAHRRPLVQIETRIVERVSRAPLDRKSVHFLTPRDLRQDWADAKTRHSVRLTAFDRQPATITTGDAVPGRLCQLRPVLSTDRRFVTLSLRLLLPTGKGYFAQESHRTVTMPKEGVAAVPVGERRWLLVRATPILLQEIAPPPPGAPAGEKNKRKNDRG